MCTAQPIPNCVRKTVHGSIYVNLLCLKASDCLIQQTGHDPVTPSCQGECGETMAVGATAGESQLQRIIRDLHGTPALCVCSCSREGVNK